MLAVILFWSQIEWASSWASEKLCQASLLLELTLVTAHAVDRKTRLATASPTVGSRHRRTPDSESAIQETAPAARNNVCALTVYARGAVLL
jgi:hypothetical protein